MAPNKGLTWKESYRGRLHMTAYVQAKCSSCGMYVDAASKGNTHGRLFEPWCNGKPRPTARKRYRQSFNVGGWWVDPKTLPQDILDRMTALAARARAEGRTLHEWVKEV